MAHWVERGVLGEGGEGRGFCAGGEGYPEEGAFAAGHAAAPVGEFVAVPAAEETVGVQELVFGGVVKIYGNQADGGCEGGRFVCCSCCCYY